MSLIISYYERKESVVKMQDIKDFVRSIEMTEKLFSLVDLYAFICSKFDETFQVGREWYIVPFYVHGGKRYELYYYELKIAPEGSLDFIDYALSVTGKANIECIPEETLEMYRKCYIKCDGVKKHVLEKLIEYLEFIFEYKPLQEEVKKVYGITDFDRNELYAAIYP